jgi:hypothetical protein
MTAMASLLPAGFEALEPFAPTWAVEELAEREALRGRASAAARADFYAAASPLLEAALDRLDKTAITAFDARESRLMWLMLSLAHVALAQEVQGEDEPRHAHLRSFVPFTRSSS